MAQTAITIKISMMPEGFANMIKSDIKDAAKILLAIKPVFIFNGIYLDE